MTRWHSNPGCPILPARSLVLRFRSGLGPRSSCRSTCMHYRTCQSGCKFRQWEIQQGSRLCHYRLRPALSRWERLCSAQRSVPEQFPGWFARMRPELPEKFLASVALCLAFAAPRSALEFQAQKSASLPRPGCSGWFDQTPSLRATRCSAHWFGLLPRPLKAATWKTTVLSISYQFTSPNHFFHV